MHHKQVPCLGNFSDREPSPVIMQEPADGESSHVITRKPAVGEPIVGKPTVGEPATCEPDLFHYSKSTRNELHSSRYNWSVLHELLIKDALLTMFVNAFHSYLEDREYLDAPYC